MNKKFFALLKKPPERLNEVTGTAAVSFTLSEDNGIREITVLGRTEHDSAGGLLFLGDLNSDGQFSIPVRIHTENGFTGKNLATAFKVNNPSIKVTVYANTRFGFSCPTATNGILLGKSNMRFKDKTHYTFALPMTVPAESVDGSLMRTQLGVLYTDGQIDEIAVENTTTAYDIDFVTNPEKTVVGLTHVFVNSGVHYVKFKGAGIYEKNLGSVANYKSYSGTTYTLTVKEPLRAINGDGISVCDELRCIEGKIIRRVGKLSFSDITSEMITLTGEGVYKVFKVALPSPASIITPIIESDLFSEVSITELGQYGNSATINGTGSQLLFTLDSSVTSVSDAANVLSQSGATVIYPLASELNETVSGATVTRTAGYVAAEILTANDPTAITVKYK